VAGGDPAKPLSLGSRHVGVGVAGLVGIVAEISTILALTVLGWAALGWAALGWAALGWPAWWLDSYRAKR
jgi:hypothetical protein